MTAKKILAPFKAWRESEGVSSKYVNIVIDHPPYIPPTTEVCFSFSNGLIIPCKATPEDSGGIPPMLQAWQSFNQARTMKNPLRLLGIFINDIDKRKAIQVAFAEGVKNGAVTSKYFVPWLLSNSACIIEKSHERMETKKGSVFDYTSGRGKKIKDVVMNVCEHFYKGVNDHG
jgi:cellulose biosynthesis protein BcsQ